VILAIIIASIFGLSSSDTQFRYKHLHSILGTPNFLNYDRLTIFASMIERRKLLEQFQAVERVEDQRKKKEIKYVILLIRKTCET